MHRLPTEREIPAAVSLEKETKQLASLTISDALKRVMDELLVQWMASDRLKPLSQYGIHPMNRALFYGPPGNGKTVAAQLIASKIGCPLYRVCCEALLTSAFGGTPKNIANVMDFLETAGKCVVLWDECETLFPDRQQSGSDSCTRELVQSMQIFWQRLDRWKTPQLFILATNLADRLDSALTSRIELHLEFGPPTAQQVADVLMYWCETLHEYGSEEWGPKLAQTCEERHPTSFRELWQAISSCARDHAVKQ